MKCKNCNSTNLSFQVPLFIEFSIEDYCKITKKSFSKATTQVLGASWDRCKFICKDCGQIQDLNDIES